MFVIKVENVKCSIEIKVRVDVEIVFIKEDYSLTVTLRVLLKD